MGLIGSHKSYIGIGSTWSCKPVFIWMLKCSSNLGHGAGNQRVVFADSTALVSCLMPQQVVAPPGRSACACLCMGRQLEAPFWWHLTHKSHFFGNISNQQTETILDNVSKYIYIYILMCLNITHLERNPVEGTRHKRVSQPIGLASPLTSRYTSWFGTCRNPVTHKLSKFAMVTWPDELKALLLSRPSL